MTLRVRPLVDPPGTSTGRYLKDDLTWDTPSGGGGGDSITVNGVAVTNADLDDATPAAPGGDLNVKWQKDASSPANVSGYVDVSVLEPLLTLGNLSGTIATAQIAAAAVTYAKIQDVSATARLLGRVSSGAGDVEEVTPTQALAMLGIQRRSKSADETITSDATLSLDADLQVELEANTDYQIDGFLVFAAATAPDYKWSWQVPTSCVMRWNHTSGAVGTTPATETQITIGAALGATTDQSHSFRGLIRNGANAGTLGVTWAQNTSDASNTTLRQASWIEVRRVP